MDFKKITEIYLEENGNKYACILIQAEENNVYNITHTYVSEDHRGEGLAAKLVKEAIEYVRSLDGNLKADCSYGAVYFDKHDIDYIK